MKKILIHSLVVFLCTNSASAQNKIISKNQQYVDLSAGFGKSQGTFSTGYYRNRTILNTFFIGTGVRLNGFWGKNLNFTSAPASLASDATKTDTLVTPSPSIYALNAFINLGYNVNDKLQAGFNIDVVGFSFGPQGTPLFKGNGTTINTSAKPTSLNLLLVGNNDKGSLNSEFYLRYKLNNKIGVKLAYDYNFNELTTATNVQTLPSLNNRFRNKGSLLGIGISVHF